MIDGCPVLLDTELSKRHHFVATTEANSSPVSYHSNPLELIRPSINGLGKVWLQYLSATFLYLMAMVLTMAVAGGVAWAAYRTGAAVGVIIVEAFVVGLILLIGASIFFMPAFYRIILAAAHQRTILLRKAFEDDWSVGVRLVLTQLLAGIFILVGLVLLVVPGLVLFVRFSLVPYVVIEEKLSGLEALRRSRDLVRGRSWEIWGLFGLGGVAGALSFVPVLGTLLSSIAAILLMPTTALRYLEIKELKAADASAKTPISGWNYGLLAITIVVLAWSVGTSWSHRSNGATDQLLPSQAQPY